MASVPENSVLGSLFFLTYINGLPDGLKTNAKLIADDTSLFTTAKDKNEAANALNNDLSLISKLIFNWKMLFNPGPHKPGQEALFSRKKRVLIHPAISLHNIQVEKVSYQKHPGFFFQ